MKTCFAKKELDHSPVYTIQSNPGRTRVRLTRGEPCCIYTAEDRFALCPASRQQQRRILQNGDRLATCGVGILQTDLSLKDANVSGAVLFYKTLFVKKGG